MTSRMSGRHPSAGQTVLPSPYGSAASTHRKNALAGLKRQSSSSLAATTMSTKSERICALLTRVLQKQPPPPSSSSSTSLLLHPRSHCPQLNALVLDVHDISCAQLQYRLLGTKRYWYRSVKQEPQGAKRWEVKLFEVRCRKSVLETLAAATATLYWNAIERLASADAHLTCIGFFDSERQAIAASDAAVRARDVTNPFTGMHVSRSPLPDGLAPVVAIHVVSTAFERRSQRERLCMVYELLFDALEALVASGTNNMSLPTDDVLTALPLDDAVVAAAVLGDVRHVVLGSDLRGFSGCVSTHVAALPLWRALTLHLRVTAATPAQWRANMTSSTSAAALLGDTDRFGPSHVANDRALAVDSALLPASRGLVALVTANHEDAATPSSALPHFYHGLPAELKRMIADEQMRADVACGNNQLRQKLLLNTEAAFAQRFAKRRRAYAFAAIKLQRALRMRSQRRILRLLFQRQYGALALQRLFRGHCARTFARAYWRVATCAALLIQSVVRAHFSRQETRALRARMLAAAMLIQRVWRGHCARKYVQWRQRLESSAVAVQRVVRGFVSRQRVRRIRTAQYRLRVVIPAATRIQCVWRGYCGRRVAADKRATQRKLDVLHPAAVRIERLLRGYLARRVAAKFRTADYAARTLQRFWRTQRYRTKWRALMVQRHCDRMASRIGAFGRGYVVRKFYRRERRRQYVQRVLQPAAVHIQRMYRGYAARQQLEILRDRTEAAITLQHMWRKRTCITTISTRLRGFRIALRDARAATIQRAFRCFCARQQRTYLQLAYRGRAGKAAIAIQAAWRSFCAREQLRAFRFCARIERMACTLTESKDERELLAFDTADARSDVQRVVKYKAKALRRIQELKAMRIEWERRQPFVAKELAALTPEDIDRGWDEAFTTEQHVLRFSLELSVEDILAHRQQVREYDAELDDLRLELEDLERDDEESVLRETAALEAYRDMELAHAHARFAADRTRKIRMQRIRWRIKSDRKHVVRRARNDLAMQRTLQQQNVADLGALSFERKQLLQLRMQQAVERAAAAGSHDALQLVAQRRDTEIVRGLDDGLARVRAILDGHSVAYHTPKADMRESPAVESSAAAATIASTMCGACGRITCDCDSYGPPSATKRYNTTFGAAKAQALADATTAMTANTSPAQLTRSRLARRPRYQD